MKLRSDLRQIKSLGRIWNHGRLRCAFMNDDDLSIPNLKSLEKEIVAGVKWLCERLRSKYF